MHDRRWRGLTEGFRARTPERLHRSGYARFLRGGVVVLVFLPSLALARDQFHTPTASPASGAETEFSAERAMSHIEAVAVAPRPQGSAAAAEAREYIVGALESLGLSPEVQTTTAVRTTAGTDAVFGARVANVAARIPGTDSTGAIVLNGHYDSGPNALGAGDCGACVATVLETARALLAGPPLRNDLILLFADGEETQLFGGYAFVQQHPWADDVAFALNLESQGVDGPAVFYVSSANDAEVAAKVLDYAGQPAAWSYISTLVRGLVGGSDLDSFTDEGIPGAGVAFFESEQYYHTRLDRPEQLDRGSVQHLGDYALDVVRGFGDDDLAALDANDDGIYVTLWRGAVLTYSPVLALPLALIATAGFAVALTVGHRRRMLAAGRVGLAAGLFVGTLFLAVILASVLWQLVRITNPDYQVFLIGVTYDADRFLLAFAALAVALFVAARLWGARRLGALEVAGGALAVWWFATVLTAVLLPTFSPLFVWPLLAGLAVLLFTLLRPTTTEQPWGHVAGIAVIAVPTLLLVFPAVVLFWTLGGRLEALLGVPVIGLPVLMAALASGLLAAFVPFPPLRREWLLVAGPVALAAALVVWTSTTSGFDADHPKPNMVMYDLDADTGSASWLTTGGAGLGFGRDGLIDGWTSQFLGEAAQPDDVAGWSAGPGQTAPGFRDEAPVADLPPPRIEVLADDVAADQRSIQLRVSSPRGAPNIRLHLDAPVAALSIDGVEADVAQLGQGDGLWIYYLALPPEGVEIALRLGTPGALEVELQDWSQGLPQLEGFTVEQRPDEMMPSAHDLADTTMIRATYVVNEPESESMGRVR